MRRFGRFIDPAVELPFRFDGAPMRGFAGDTILSALWRNQERAFSRSFKLRRWRGPLSLAADDGATMIDIEGEPNVVAATRPLTANLEIKSRLRAGAASRLLSASVFGRSLAAPLLRPGFYHRAFFRPRGAWPLWERVIRRLAAEGEIAERGGARARRENLFCDFAVVGGGVAGLSAAVAAAQRGETILFDSSPLVGGAVARFFSDESETLRRLREAARASPRLRILPSFRVNGFFADDLLTAVDSAGCATICARAKKTVFAVGARAQPIVFRGNDIPGVMLVDAAAKLVADYDLACGRNVVVIGRDERDLSLARLLVEHGARVAAVLLLADSDLADSANAVDLPAGIEIRRGIESLEAVAVAGGARLSSICFTSGARAERIECDCALMNGGRVAAAELPLCAGAAWRLSAAGPILDLRDLPPSIALAGAVNGARTIDEAAADGEAAIEKIASGEKRAAKRRSKKESEEEAIDAAPAAPLGADANANTNAIFRHEKGGEFVDFDHDLEIRDIEAAIDEGFDDPELLKRWTTCGMGVSQGRYSNLQALRILARARGEEAQIGATRTRPPTAPESLAQAAAGARLFPQKLSPLHRRHLLRGAHFTVAGEWLRPSFYGGEAQIEAESEAARAGAGVCDVSTLGKIIVGGAGAGDLLRRAYALPPLAPGRSRYVVALAENGVLAHDGVAARLAGGDYYLTVPTASAAAAYRRLTFWNARFATGAIVADATDAFAAVIVCGPDAAAALRAIGIDLADATAHEARRLDWGGEQVIAMRPDFVGKSSFEIHAPAALGQSLWDALCERCEPFGLEAMRVLRLEAGRVIVGHDTDDLSYPPEAGLGWTVAKSEGFIGETPLAHAARRGFARRLVGWTLRGEWRGRVAEGDLILSADAAVEGRVTSVAYSPAAGRVIGFAYAAADAPREGGEISIRLRDGARLSARTVRLPLATAR